ncbi:uncharacterized protein LOC8264005 [Ricinus communis]|uniref:Transmembrane protein n=1 Tax=Ricinus communis TaxID=3988 RepID=B9SW48_RICCO|nr:uncharacterized protein LOC8264005 [Ricinus communis]EEF32164.1 conserved hypothetical protein [Ricinus communis]|eukprot:XP_002530217.1 uncharacterized protein LOC8264005 [Ricinus communis]
MESIKNANFQTKSRNLHFLHLLTKFLAAMFFFSVIFLCSSLLPFLFSSSSIGKNYMFLLCNGILVLIVKNSGLMADSDQEVKPTIKNEGSSQKLTPPPSASETKTVVAEATVVVAIEDKSSVMLKGNVAGEQGTETGVIDDGVEEEDEEEEIELLSAEELNKKCDDFIRRMKEAIKYQ